MGTNIVSTWITLHEGRQCLLMFLCCKTISQHIPKSKNIENIWGTYFKKKTKS